MPYALRSAPSFSRRRLLRSGLAAGVLAATNVACRQGASRAGAKTSTTPTARRKRLTLSWWLDTGYPSPFAFSSLGPGGVVRLSELFDSLVWKDDKGIIPWLAKSWEMQNDGQTLILHLRPSVTWHDGQPFSADDVAFSFEYFAQHPFSWADTSSVSSARAIDAQTVSVRLKQPFAPFLHDVTGVLPMIPRHVWAKVSDPLKDADPSAVVGTGPFVFSSYSEGQGAYLFKANDRHFAGRPAFDELAYELVPTQQQVVALQRGGLDGALANDFDVQAKFQTGRYRVLPSQPFSVVRLVFNVDRPPLDQQLFRQAIAYALDRQQIGQRVAHGDITVGSAGIIPPESPWFVSGLPQYAYDPARANTMLDAIGYQRTAGSATRQTAQGAPLRVQLLADLNSPDAELVQSMLARVGVGVDIVSADPKTRTDRLAALDYQMGLLSHIGIGGDPDYLRLWYAGKAGNAFAQGNVLHDAAFTRIADQQAAELDERQRQALVAKMQEILAADLPTLPLYYRRFYWIYDPAARNRWFNTWSGIMTGIPLADNKLALLQG